MMTVFVLFCAQLSGGMDSTLVSYFANKKKDDNLNDSVSIVSEKEGQGEADLIDYVGKQLKLNNHKFIVTDQYLLDNYEKAVWHNDAPIYKQFFANFLRLAEESKKHVTVLLSGEGADEIAGGYSRFAVGVFQPFISRLGNVKKMKSYNSYAEYAVMTGSTFTNILPEGYDNASNLIQQNIS